MNGAEHSPLAWLLHRAAGGRTADAGSEPAAREVAGAAVGDGVGRDHRQTPVGAAGAGFEADGAETAFGSAGDDQVGDDPDMAFGVNPVGPDAEYPDFAVAALRAAADRFAGLSAQRWLDEMHAFARRVPGAVSARVLDAEPPPARAPEHREESLPAFAARASRRPLRRTRTLTSFSALTAADASTGIASRRSPARREEAQVDRPDHDQHEAPADAAGDETGAAGAGAGTGERSAFTFPRGPVAGSCLHRIFERLDDSPEIGTDRRGLDETCRVALDEFGIDGAWRAVARTMVEQTRSVVLRESAPASREGAPDTDDLAVSVAGGDAGGFRLADPHRRLVELEFHFPVQGLDRDRLAARMVEHGYPDPFAGAMRAGASASSPPIRGFLRGFVDLVVEHAGRWYVVDYKSNWLGPAAHDYGPKALDTAMRDGGYTLQSLIYLVALHRYLSVRLAGYEYERHLGGAFYLFVRGIDPAAGASRGVHFDRPTAECLRALDECFRGGAA